ncbi:MAG: hypothetical protein FWC84_00390 [Alphaproteobacteria bacterium]|nr:hypothetical protein [Alphaproteobacteria bacterium]
MSYLAPPPMPAAVIVTKDVGGYVTDYQKQTDHYRSTQREVRLHECRSACTLALSLPNVCVYKDSILKFHLAYDPRNHQPNEEVSREMFASYPAAVQARLGTLTRDYKVLRGQELIALGIRDCNGPRPIEPKPSDQQILVASATPHHVLASVMPAASSEPPALANLMDKVPSIFGSEGPNSWSDATAAAQTHLVSVPAAHFRAAEMPLPPQRPVEFTPPESDIAHTRKAEEAKIAVADATPVDAASTTSFLATSAVAPLPRAERSPGTLHKLTLPKLISGAQPILPPNFSVYADLDR